MAAKDYTPIGSKHGILTVAGLPFRTKNWVWRVACQCECGNTTQAPCNRLISGELKSCGCLMRKGGGRPPQHGHAAAGSETSQEYQIWLGMHKRCNNPESTSYDRYGARGITVCERWASFENFLADMGPRPSPSHSLDREKNHLGYSPSNCRWATATQQANNRSSNIVLMHNGEEKTLMQIAMETGTNYRLLRRRLRRDGWTLERALATPPRPMRQR